MEKKKPFVLRDMGSFLYGGIAVTKEDGSKGHYDHGYAQYFIPEAPTNYPVIFWHGNGQSGKCWETTPDGREGFREIFLHRDIPVYVIDQPRLGRASHTEHPELRTMYYPTSLIEERHWEIFRYGSWKIGENAHLFEGSRVAHDPTSLDQFLRQTCNTHGDQPITLEYGMELCKTGKELLKWTGPSVLFTWSNSGKYGWFTAGIDPTNIKAIFTYEPGQPAFPDDFDYQPLPTPCKELREIQRPYVMPAEQWMNLTKFPIRAYFGDFIIKEPMDNYGFDCWRLSMEQFKAMFALINERGGDAKLIHLPDVGIYGNSHNAMAESNNVEIAKLMFEEMRSLGLLEESHPYEGPFRQELSEFDVTVEPGEKFPGK